MAGFMEEVRIQLVVVKGRTWFKREEGYSRIFHQRSEVEFEPAGLVVGCEPSSPGGLAPVDTRMDEASPLPATVCSSGATEHLHGDVIALGKCKSE